MATPLWSPSDEQQQATQLADFMRTVNGRHGLHLRDYSALHEWSVRDSENFWSEFWDYADIQATRKGERVLVDADKMPGARWFPDAHLNFAENLLRHRDERLALVFRDEQGRQRRLTHAELYRAVAQLASAMRARGIRSGDRVSGFMPNMAETVIAMLATTSLGAVWSSCSPDFGVHGVVDRFGQIEPRMLIAADGYRYNGKQLDCLERLQGIVGEIPSIESVVVVPYQHAQPDLSGIPNAQLWDDVIDHEAADIEFTPTGFDHPLYIMFSSGTTGVPKCIVHSVGGTLIQHKKELMLHCDLRREDTIFFYTTCGWMMWNWLVSGLAIGSTVVLYDGSPMAPRAECLWDMAQEEGITVFGTSARYLSALERVGCRTGTSHDVRHLRAILSTGSPLAPETFDYVYREIKSDLLLASISGGTDIISCFALGCPIRPVYAGELQCRGLGMAVDVFDDNGRPIRGEKGELVCTQPFPSMPIGFWDDPDQTRYHDAYFATFDNVWAHGDYAEITPRDGLIIHGRSDTVLNPGGVRIGTAEIYRQVEKVDAVVESLCIGQPWQDDERVVLFVRLRDGVTLDEALTREIRQTVRANTTPRHVPARVIQVDDIPRTLSGKLVEMAVRKVVMGETVQNKDALANPEALELFRDLPELEA